jgi:hypothetical protein
MANILASQSVEMRAMGEALIQQADKLLCKSRNERMWSDGDRHRRAPHHWAIRTIFRKLRNGRQNLSGSI